MIRHAQALAYALLLAGAAQAQPPGKALEPFNVQEPRDLIVLLDALGAKATIAERAADTVLLRVETSAYGFSALFAGCDVRGRACRAVAFSTQSEQRAPTLAQLNAFTQTSLTCRVWQDKAGKAHVMYAALISAADSRSEMETHLGAWQGCLAEFGDFLKNPAAYLASAP